MLHQDGLCRILNAERAHVTVVEDVVYEGVQMHVVEHDKLGRYLVRYERP